MATDRDRASFEHWHIQRQRSRGYGAFLSDAEFVTRDESGRYRTLGLDDAFEAWCAALAAPPVEQQAAAPDEGQLERWRSLSDALLGMDHRNMHFPTIREAAFQLQNAYIACRDLAKLPTAQPAPQAGAAEPMAYQYRTAPYFDTKGTWSEWIDCSRESYLDYRKTPKLHDWLYETRTLSAVNPMDVENWAELYRLREAVKGPDGYDTWQDAATAERVRRVKAERALAEQPSQDAERYQALRKSVGNPVYCAQSTQFGVRMIHSAALDDACDKLIAARAAQGESTGGTPHG